MPFSLRRSTFSGHEGDLPSARFFVVAVIPAFDLAKELDRVLGLMHKYANIPMSLADACLVRMSETFAEPILLTTDADFRVYRRHGRQVVPCLTPR